MVVRRECRLFEFIEVTQMTPADEYSLGSFQVFANDFFGLVSFFVSFVCKIVFAKKHHLLRMLSMGKRTTPRTKNEYYNIEEHPENLTWKK